MAAVLEKQTKRWTYEEYYRLDEDQRYEIIDGNLLMAPAPDMWHQDSSRKLFRLIDRFVTRNKLGEVFYAPFDVVLDAAVGADQARVRAVETVDRPVAGEHAPLGTERLDRPEHDRPDTVDNL
jgi:Uma2 family endonuclease